MTEKNADGGAAELTAAVQSEFVRQIGATWARVERLDALSKTIIRRIQDERGADVRLGLALLQCPTPAEAYGLYMRWASERTAALLADGPKLAQMWTQLYLQKDPDTPAIPK